MKQNIEIKDFGLFYEVIKATAKIVDSAKLIVSSNGLEIYGARSKIARCEITSDSIFSGENIDFSIENLQMFLRILQSVKDIHENDYSGLKFFLDAPFIRFESRKFKTKYTTCNENIIQPWISKKVQTEMKSVFDFTSTCDFIKRVNSHSFMFSDPKSVRVYLETKDDMENNAVFATLGNKETQLNNELTIKFGLVTSGSLRETDEAGLVTGERRIILDLERLNLFNAVQSESIKFQLMSVNCLVSKSKVSGQNGSFFDLNLYSTVLKS